MPSDDDFLRILVPIINDEEDETIEEDEDADDIDTEEDDLDDSEDDDEP